MSMANEQMTHKMFSKVKVVKQKYFAFLNRL